MSIANAPMYFWLVSALNGMVIDIRGGDTAPDTPITTWPRKQLTPIPPGHGVREGTTEADNQLWITYYKFCSKCIQLDH
jgi:hypothetical protein